MSARQTCRLLLLCTLLSVLSGKGKAQDYPRGDINPERLVEDLFPAQNLDLNYEELYDQLLQFLSNPLDLNRATAEDLRARFVLREEQVQSLLAHRARHGPFLSVYELQSVENFDSATIARFIPLVKVPEAGSTFDHSIWQRIRQEKNGYVLLRHERTLEEKKGYKNTTDSAGRYAGSPDRLLCRVRLSRPGDFSLALTAEKDAGEAITWNPARRTYGMDFYSFHSQVMNKGRVKNLIAGDYLAQFGQGLVLGGGFGMGKGAETITAIRRSNLGFLPYSSVTESGFFRGTAVSYSLREHLTLHTFVSSLRRDGSISQDTTSAENSIISSFAITGYHRTPGERKTRKQIPENNIGMVLQYSRPSLDLGVLFLRTQFSAPILRAPTPYNQFAFRGRQNTDMGFYLNYTLNNLTFFSEIAQTLQHGAAVTAGILASITHQFDVSLQYRHFSRTFTSFYSNAVAESTVPQNESGIYWGGKYQFNKKWSAAGYFDYYTFPWLRYRAYAPGAGTEWLLRGQYQSSKRMVFYIQVREETRPRNMPDPVNLYETRQGTKRNYWINLDYASGPHLNFKVRVQFSQYTLAGKTTRGMALIQDVSLDLGKVSLSARYALFHTDDYDNRLYVYERDAAMALSFPAYYGAGVRKYLLIQWNVSEHIDFWIRWARTRFTDRDAIGSAGETILGNTKNDLKLQVRVKF